MTSYNGCLVANYSVSSRTKALKRNGSNRSYRYLSAIDKIPAQETIDMKKPYKFLIATLVAIVLGGVIGYFTVDPAINLVTSWSNIKNGPWTTNFAVGSTGANPYVRTWTAINGLMALNKSETVYLDAYTDDNGETLVGASDYTIQGPAPAARYWNLTVYNENGFLIPNDQNRWSFSSTDIQFEPDGSFKIYLSSTPKQGNWLPTGNAKTLNLYLRLHNPGPVYLDAKTMQAAQLPHITKGSGQ